MYVKKLTRTTAFVLTIAAVAFPIAPAGGGGLVIGHVDLIIALRLGHLGVGGELGFLAGLVGLCLPYAAGLFALILWNLGKLIRKLEPVGTDAVVRGGDSKPQDAD